MPLCGPVSMMIPYTYTSTGSAVVVRQKHPQNGSKRHNSGKGKQVPWGQPGRNQPTGGKEKERQQGSNCRSSPTRAHACWVPSGEWRKSAVVVAPGGRLAPVTADIPSQLLPHPPPLASNACMRPCIWLKSIASSGLVVNQP